MRSSWKQVTAGIAPGLILGPVFFNNFINVQDNEAKCTLNKSAVATEPVRAAETPTACNATQGELLPDAQDSNQYISYVNTD